MSTARKTRCKAGDRTRIINAVNRQNIGLIVVVVRPYRDNEVADGASCVNDKNTWVVVSLGCPIVGKVGSEVSANRTAIFNDAHLVPLDAYGR